MDRPRFLIVNPFGIGDVTFSTPLIEILKKSFPDSYIGYVCNRRVSDIILTNPDLNKIFVYEKDDFRQAWKRSKLECAGEISALLGTIKKERFDISIDLSLGYQYSMFLKFLGIRKRLGFNYRKRGRFLTDKIDIEGFDNKHVVDYYLDVLRLLDIDTKGYEIRPRIYVSDADSKFAGRILEENGVGDQDLVIGMVPGCGVSWGVDAEYRRWPRRNFAALADMLIAKYNARVMLLGSQKESDVSAAVANMMKHDAMNFCGKTSIGEFLGVLKRCNVVITNEGGPLHMAVGVGARTVSIFGPVDEAIYGPYRDDYNHVVLSRKDLACRPCYRRFKYKKCEKRLCLDSITAEEALEAARKILSR